MLLYLHDFAIGRYVQFKMEYGVYVFSVDILTYVMFL